MTFKVTICDLKPGRSISLLMFSYIKYEALKKYFTSMDELGLIEVTLQEHGGFEL